MCRFRRALRQTRHSGSAQRQDDRRKPANQGRTVFQVWHVCQPFVEWAVWIGDLRLPSEESNRRLATRLGRLAWVAHSWLLAKSSLSLVKAVFWSSCKELELLSSIPSSVLCDHQGHQSGWGSHVLRSARLDSPRLASVDRESVGGADRRRLDAPYRPALRAAFRADPLTCTALPR